jgi:hypothetical protein
MGVRSEDALVSVEVVGADEVGWLLFLVEVDSSKLRSMWGT